MARPLTNPAGFKNSEKVLRAKKAHEDKQKIRRMWAIIIVIILIVSTVALLLTATNTEPPKGMEKNDVDTKISGGQE